MNSILKQAMEQFEEMNKLTMAQKFTIGDSFKFAQRHQNIIRCIEDLEKSRDNWRRKCEELKIKIKELEK